MKKLKAILKFVIKETKEDITVMSRERAINDARSIYCKLAREHTGYTFKHIGESLGQNHATVIHAVKNVFPQAVASNESCKRAYNKFNNIANGISEKEVNLINDLKLEIITLKTEIKEAAERQFTINEQLSRELNSEDKKVYDERANLVLKSFEWKAREANRKEDFEIVNCYSRLECF